MTNCFSKLIDESAERCVDSMEFDGLFEFLDEQAIKTENYFKKVMREMNEKVYPDTYIIGKHLFDQWRQGDFKVNPILWVYHLEKGADVINSELNGIINDIHTVVRLLCPNERMWYKFVGRNYLQNTKIVQKNRIGIQFWLGTRRESQKRFVELGEYSQPPAFVKRNEELIFHKAKYACAREGCDAVAEKMSKCGSCECVRYCSRECQKAAWKAGHKDHCVLYNVSAMVSWFNDMKTE